ncbi:MAG TPA: hypothetical protein PLN52_10205 [Opitutaceae bacterium]|nr:hypothetical protein [Opitutaceae bacterium]
MVVTSLPPVSLRETVVESPFHALDQTPDFRILGSVRDDSISRVWLRVTDGRGVSHTTWTRVENRKFSAAFPRDFSGAAPLVAAAYFLDAGLYEQAPAQVRAEAVVLVYSSSPSQVPDLPTAFTTNLRGDNGGVDADSPEWGRVRSLLNLYYQSRSATLAGIARSDFDLARPADLIAFKRSLALYDFDARDRDWGTPLGRRVARSFWQAVWDTWFGPSNSSEDPLGSEVYPAFTFANDTADLLVAHLRRWQLSPVTRDPAEDDLAVICNEVLSNLVALQRTEDDAAPVQRGVEGAGAFYYGMFSNGKLMLDGTGWFADPQRRDHRRGGVFLGRSLWALGEALARPLPGMDETQVRQAFILGVRWGFGGARDYSDEGQPYVRVVQASHGSESPRLLWRSVGEHAYLLLGLLAACERAELAASTVFAPGEAGYSQRQTVADVAHSALEALTDVVLPEGYWSTFADVDATAVEALAKGASVFAYSPLAKRWRETAVRVAAGWLQARPAPEDYRGPVILPIGRRVPEDSTVLRYRAHRSTSTHLTYFHAGLWMQALAELETLTGDPQYRRRLEEVAGYFCGNNPFDARLLTETGGVYNFVTDTDGDTVEDRLHYDLYPESTAFVQIGLLRHLARRAQATLTHTHP